MKATDMWLYMCACHGATQHCPAIDYMIHNINYSTTTLNDSKNFDNRFEIKDEQIKHLGLISRRIYRFLSHTFFHHPEVFDEFEAKTFMCKRFTEFTTLYGLMSSDNYIIKEGSAMEYFKKSSQAENVMGNNSEPPLPAANETIKEARLEKSDADTAVADMKNTENVIA